MKLLLSVIFLLVLACRSAAQCPVGAYVLEHGRETDSLVVNADSSAHLGFYFPRNNAWEGIPGTWRMQGEKELLFYDKTGTAYVFRFSGTVSPCERVRYVSGGPRWLKLHGALTRQ